MHGRRKTADETNTAMRVIVTGLMAQHPLGGLTWHYAQYVAGLARLGHDVYYIEDTGMWPYALDGGSTGTDFIVDNGLCQREVHVGGHATIWRGRSLVVQLRH